MKTQTQTVIGVIFFAIGLAWLGWAEVTWMFAPTAIASEAPYRHVENRNEIDQKDLFNLSFGIARDLSARSPHPLGASIPIILAYILLRRPQPKDGN
jgi:hypothetical protein